MKTINHQKSPFISFVTTGVLLVIATTGFVRMAYGAVLPYMRESLSLTFSQSGLLGSSMFLGYLVTVGLSGLLSLRFGAKNVILAGSCSVIAGLIGLGSATSFWPAACFMFIAGAGSAIVFTPLMSLMIAWFPDNRGLVVGLLLSGAGMGMILSGMLIPWAVASYPPSGWRTVWLAFAAFNLVTVALAAAILRNPAAVKPEQNTVNKQNWLSHSVLRKIAFLYFLVGMAYLIPILYQTAYLIGLGHSPAAAGQVFAFAGIFSIIGAPIWGYIADRLGTYPTLLLVFVWIIAGNLLPLAFPGILGFMLSSVIWGTGTGGLMALIQVAASQQVPQKYIAAVIGFISVFYAVGQMLGPGTAGLIIEHYGGFSGAYWFGAVLYAICLVVAFTLCPSKGQAKLPT
jgi:MFS family permease